MTRRATVLGLALAACLAGCGKAGQPIVVSAASSLNQALPAYELNARYTFGGSDQLAAQIRKGLRPDVYAAANTTLPQQLFRERLVEKPVFIATNKLVIAVPARSHKIRSIDDLARPGVKIAVGAPSNPVGSYARQALARLPKAKARAIERNIRSNEPDVGGVIAKISNDSVDAGFVYFTDVKAAHGRVRAIQLPASLRPTIVYAAAVVKGSKHHDDAVNYIRGLVHAPSMRRAGFGPPPTT